jgi:hypothetical protein
MNLSACGEKGLFVRAASSLLLPQLLRGSIRKTTSALPILHPLHLPDWNSVAGILG